MQNVKKSGNPVFTFLFLHCPIYKCIILCLAIYLNLWVYLCKFWYFLGNSGSPVFGIGSNYNLSDRLFII